MTDVGPAFRYSLVAWLFLELAQCVAVADEPAADPGQALFFTCRLLEVEAAEGERGCELLTPRELDSNSQAWLLVDDAVVRTVMQQDGVNTLVNATVLTTRNQPVSFHSGGTFSFPEDATDEGEREVTLGSLIELVPENAESWLICLQYRTAKLLPAGPAITTIRISFSADFRHGGSHICLLPAGQEERRIIAVVSREEGVTTRLPASR